MDGSHDHRLPLSRMHRHMQKRQGRRLSMGRSRRPARNHDVAMLRRFEITLSCFRSLSLFRAVKRTNRINQKSATSDFLNCRARRVAAKKVEMRMLELA